MSFTITKDNDKHIINFYDTSADDFVGYMQVMILYIYENYSLDHDIMETFDISNTKIFDCRYDLNDKKWKNYKFASSPTLDGVYFFKMISTIDLVSFDYFNKKYVDFIIEIDKIMENPHDIILNDLETFELQNYASGKQGINPDLRGVHYQDWNLHYWQSYSINKKKSMSVHDIMTCCFKIKSHKFDNWYELYCNLNSIKCKKDQGYTFAALVNFDHGS